jgi:serine/threonine-protein kinase
MPGNRDRGGMLPGTELQQPARVLAAAPSPGEIIATKYRVERVLGAGGMGVVVAAHHLQLDARSRLSSCFPER